MLPVIERVARASAGCVISVDTSKPEVMRAAVGGRRRHHQRRARAARARGARGGGADSGCAVCLMHMQGEPRTMQQSPALRRCGGRGARLPGRARRAPACAAGIAAERLALDPGFGFGKTLEHNLALLRRPAASSRRSGRRCWSGCRASRMLGRLTGRAARRAAARQRCAGGAGGAAAGRASSARTMWRRPSMRCSGGRGCCRGRRALGREYFGTDGVRGRVGEHPMTVDFALHLASAAARVLAPEGGAVLIGKDTRAVRLHVRVGARGRLRRRRRQCDADRAAADARASPT